MQQSDDTGAPLEDVEVRELLAELEELQAIDRRRRLEPRGSATYASAVEEVNRRSRALIERLRVGATVVGKGRDGRSDGAGF